MKTIFLSLFFITMLLHNTLVYAAPDGISQQDAVNIATQSFAGRVLAVKLKANVYQVKMLSTNGKVRVIRIDAKNGKINPASDTESKAD